MRGLRRRPIRRLRADAAAALGFSMTRRPLDALNDHLGQRGGQKQRRARGDLRQTHGLERDPRPRPGALGTGARQGAHVATAREAGERDTCGRRHWLRAWSPRPNQHPTLRQQLGPAGAHFRVGVLQLEASLVASVVLAPNPMFQSVGVPHDPDKVRHLIWSRGLRHHQRAQAPRASIPVSIFLLVPVYPAPDP